MKCLGRQVDSLPLSHQGSLIWFINHLFLNCSPPFTVCLYCEFGFLGRRPEPKGSSLENEGREEAERAEGEPGL